MKRGIVTCLLRQCIKRTIEENKVVVKWWETRPLRINGLLRVSTWTLMVNIGNTGIYLSSCTKCAVILVPEAPSGWPSAMAPPLTLLFSGSSPSALATAKYWGANASFTWKQNENMTLISKVCFVRVHASYKFTMSWLVTYLEQLVT